MDGENNGKPHVLMDDLGVPLFLGVSQPSMFKHPRCECPELPTPTSEGGSFGNQTSPMTPTPFTHSPDLGGSSQDFYVDDNHG